MQYRKDKYGNDISILGFGCMRFTKKAGQIDIDKAEKEILAAYEAGVNYYDSAYIYSGSEVAIGEIFRRNNIRDKINIATKLPQYLIRKSETIEKMFQEELKRLQTDYIDYYLMHMINDVKSWERLKSMGIVQWIEDKKASGAIRQIGFSYHGNSDMFCQLIDAYDWDFCMIQYNYMDEFSQAGRNGLKYAASKGVPVIIMEPLRGGRLVNELSREALDLFAKHESDRTPAQWALKWLWNQPEVMCVLSGMNSIDMIDENTKCADTSWVGELNPDDNAFLRDVGKAINARLKVGCTGCGYCMPCPQGVDIPGCFSAYNRRYTDGFRTAIKEYLQCTTFRKDVTVASRCVGCGACERHCPQGIKIIQELKEVSKILEGPSYKIIAGVSRLFMKY